MQRPRGLGANIGAACDDAGLDPENHDEAYHRGSDCKAGVFAHVSLRIIDSGRDMDAIRALRGQL
jgi:hypothetical protein